MENVKLLQPGKNPNVARNGRIQIGPIVRLGWKLVRSSPKYVALYVALSLITQTAIPQAIPVLFGKMTNLIQATGSEQGLHLFGPDNSEYSIKDPSQLVELKDGRLPGSTPTPILHGSDNKVYVPKDPSQLIRIVTSHAPAASPESPQTVLRRIFGWWLLLTFSGVVLNVGYRAASAAMDSRMKIQLRVQLLDKILHGSPEFFQANDPGRLNLILNQMGVEAQFSLRSLTIDPLLQLIGIISAIVLMVMTLHSDSHGASDVPSGGGAQALIVVGILVFFVAVSTWVLTAKSGRAIQFSQGAIQSRRFDLSTLIAGVAGAPEEIQAMKAEPVFEAKHQNRLVLLGQSEVRQGAISEAVNSGLQLPQYLGIALLTGFMIFFHGKGGLRPGAFVTVMTLAPQLLSPFRTLASLGIVANASWPVIQLVLTLLTPNSAPVDDSGGTLARDAKPSLEARDVFFAYRADGPLIFNGASFSVAEGEVTGLVARMGQGKTTFFRLALRFYDPQSGEIMLGGTPIRQLKRSEVRDTVAMMSQTPAFFHDSVEENLRVANPSAKPQKVEDLCRDTGLWPILEAAIGPDPLGKPFLAGAMLSGGQKKLFALTRCLLRGPKIILLDEPTTGMDNLEKFPLIPMLKKACVGKTVLVVDHDIPWMIKFCDRLVVLDNGKVVETGTPQELIQQDGLFKQLYEEVRCQGEITPPPSSAKTV